MERDGPIAEEEEFQKTRRGNERFCRGEIANNKREETNIKNQDEHAHLREKGLNRAADQATDVYHSVLPERDAAARGSTYRREGKKEKDH